MYFVFSSDRDGGWNVKFTPGQGGDLVTKYFRLKWDSVLGYFTMWCHLVEKELAHSDPWATVALLDITMNGSAENQGFTHSEVEESVKPALEHLREHIEEMAISANATGEQLNSINESLARLEHYAQNGMGRIDWRNQLVGLMFSVIVGLALGPEALSEIWQFWIGLVGPNLLN